MTFEKMHVKDVHCVLRFRDTSSQWQSKNRKNHFVGINISGESYHDLGYQKFTIKKNNLFFFNQRDDYKVKVHEWGESFAIHFTTYEEIETDSFCIPISNPSNIVTILQKAETADNTGNDLALFSLLYLLCSEVARIKSKTYSQKDSRISAAKTYIDEHFKEDSCIETAIANSNLSSRRFRDLFKSNYDTTPHRYISFRKIEYAKNLLSLGALSVTQVAEMCGFSNVYYFSKAFKRETGVLPSKWK